MVFSVVSLMVGYSLTFRSFCIVFVLDLVSFCVIVLDTGDCCTKGVSALLILSL